MSERKCVKFLGITIDDKLKWDEHINTAKNRISRSFFAINRARQVLSKKHLSILYHSLVYPYLSYASTYDKYLSKLYVLQKKVVRTIAGANMKAHSEPIFKSLGILKLEDVHKLHVSKYVFTYIKNALPPPLMNIFTLMQDVHDHNTRHSNILKLKVEKTRTVVATKGIINMGPQIWNSVKQGMYFTNTQTFLLSLNGFSSWFKRDTLHSYSD